MSYIVEVDDRNTANELKEGIDQLSKLPPPSVSDIAFLSMVDVVIMPPIYKLMIQLLNQPQSQAPSTGTTKRKWDCIFLVNCRIPQPRTIRLADNFHLLAATLGRRVETVAVWDSPQVMEWLSCGPPLEMEGLSLSQEVLSALDCQNLGALFQRNAHLKNLTLRGPSRLEDPQLLVECLANCPQLQKLYITESKWSSTDQRRGHRLIDMVVGPVGGNDIVGRFLLNPQSQLKILHLRSMHLDDCHFTAIVAALPTSQLEELDVANNDIEFLGLCALAKQLPKIKCLKNVDVSNNPWEFDDEIDFDDWKEFLDGLAVNYSIECLNTGSAVDSEAFVDYYCYLNWAGRRLLATSCSVPLGLWPFILERAGQGNNNGDDESTCAEQYWRLDAIYMFLQKCPVLSCIHSSHSLKTRPRKKHKIMACETTTRKML